MKRYVTAFILFLAAAFLCRAAWAEEAPAVVKPLVERITVLTDKAAVELGAEVEIPAGESTILLDPVFPTLDTLSIRAGVESDGPVTVLGLDFTRVPTPKPSVETYNDLLAQIEALQKEKTLLEADKAIYETLLKNVTAMLDGMRKVLALNAGRGKAFPADVQERLDFLSARRLDYGLKLARTKRSISDLAKEIAALQNKLRTLYGAMNRDRTVIAVHVSAQAATSGRVAVKFLVPYCGWTPSYEVNCDSKSGKLSVRYSATVIQRTGVDWDGVEVTLATASPMTALVPPEPAPWVVGKAVPVRELFAADKMLRKSKSRANRALEEMEKEEAVAENDAPEASYATARASKEGALGVSFAMPERLSLKSGVPKTVVVGFLEVDTAIVRTVVPRVSTAVYLTAEGKNTTSFPLLPGPARCFMDGMLTGVTRLAAAVPPGGKLKLPLGTDRRIKVVRKTVEDKFDERSKTIRHYYAWRMEITNASDEKATLKLKDQVPVAQNDDIRVKVTELSPKPDERTPEGILTWELELDPGGKAVVEIGFYIEYPKGMILIRE